LHKEYHEKEYAKKGGFFQMVQLWVNLPAKDKMTKPKYQGITNQQMGKYKIPENGGIVDVIAGELNGVKGPAYTFTPIEMYNIRIKKGADLTINLPDNFNTGILIIEGKVKVNGTQEAQVDHFVLFKNDGESITLNALEDSILLVLSGEPIHEPIAPYGPFLMNTKEELMQAFEDFNTGKFGVLED